MTKFLQKCPGCGSKDITKTDPAFCSVCDKTPPKDAVINSGWYRRVNDGVSVTVDPADLKDLFPNECR